MDDKEKTNIENTNKEKTNKDKLYSSGEFAKMAHITKKT